MLVCFSSPTSSPWGGTSPSGSRFHSAQFGWYRGWSGLHNWAPLLQTLGISPPSPARVPGSPGQNHHTELGVGGGGCRGVEKADQVKWRYCLTCCRGILWQHLFQVPSSKVNRLMAVNPAYKLTGLVLVFSAASGQLWCGAENSHCNSWFIPNRAVFKNDFIYLFGHIMQFLGS